MTDFDDHGSRTTTSSHSPSPEPGRLNVFGRTARYFRQVAAEMRKVVWPTRSQLITYTTVVVVFVVVFALAVLGFDLSMAKLAGIIFGG